MARALGKGGDGAPMGEQREGQRERGGRRRRLVGSGADLGSCAGKKNDGSLGGGERKWWDPQFGGGSRGPLGMEVEMENLEEYAKWRSV
jgi:hypothetical protein